MVFLHLRLVRILCSIWAWQAQTADAADDTQKATGRKDVR